MRGAGTYLRAQLERGILSCLRDKIRCITDRNEKLWGETIHSSCMEMDIPICSPEKLRECSTEDIVIIAAVLQLRQVYDELEAMGFKGKVVNICEKNIFRMGKPS